MTVRRFLTEYAKGVGRELGAMSEPECCGEPKVKISGYEAWECADAFFSLVDDGAVIDGSCPLALTETADESHRALLAHINQTRTGADAHLWPEYAKGEK